MEQRLVANSPLTVAGELLGFDNSGVEEARRGSTAGFLSYLLDPPEWVYTSGVGDAHWTEPGDIVDEEGPPKTTDSPDAHATAGSGGHAQAEGAGENWATATATKGTSYDDKSRAIANGETLNGSYSAVANILHDAALGEGNASAFSFGDSEANAGSSWAGNVSGGVGSVSASSSGQTAGHGDGSAYSTFTRSSTKMNVTGNASTDGDADAIASGYADGAGTNSALTTSGSLDMVGGSGIFSVTARPTFASSAASGSLIQDQYDTFTPGYRTHLVSTSGSGGGADELVVHSEAFLDPSNSASSTLDYSVEGIAKEVTNSGEGILNSTGTATGSYEIDSRRNGTERQTHVEGYLSGSGNIFSSMTGSPSGFYAGGGGITEVGRNSYANTYTAFDTASTHIETQTSSVASNNAGAFANASAGASRDGYDALNITTSGSIDSGGDASNGNTSAYGYGISDIGDTEAASSATVYTDAPRAGVGEFSNDLATNAGTLYGTNGTRGQNSFTTATENVKSTSGLLNSWTSGDTADGATSASSSASMILTDSPELHAHAAAAAGGTHTTGATRSKIDGLDMRWAFADATAISDATFSSGTVQATVYGGENTTFNFTVEIGVDTNGDRIPDSQVSSFSMGVLIDEDGSGIRTGTASGSSGVTYNDSTHILSGSLSKATVTPVSPSAGQKVAIRIQASGEAKLSNITTHGSDSAAIDFDFSGFSLDWT